MILKPIRKNIAKTDNFLLLFCCLPVNVCKVETILKGSLDWIPSPSLSMKIQIMVKSLVGIVNTQLRFAFTPFPPIFSIFTESEGDGIVSRLSYYFFFTLLIAKPFFIFLGHQIETRMKWICWRGKS